MVPDNHELVLASTPELDQIPGVGPIQNDLVPKLKAQYVVEVQVTEDANELTEDGKPTVTLLWTFTRNNAGGSGMPSISCTQTWLLLDSKPPRSKVPFPDRNQIHLRIPSQYFDSKLLQHAPPVSTDSPTKASFGEEVARERSTIFDKLRKPGSMSSISSFLDRRKNSSHSPAGSFFKNGSSNVSKSSLISIESTRSFNADRNPWNDSGVNLPDNDTTPGPPATLAMVVAAAMITNPPNFSIQVMQLPTYSSGFDR